MSRYLPGIIISILVFISACSKTNFDQEVHSPAATTTQLPSPCEMREDAARNIAAQKNRVPAVPGALQSPVVLLIDFNGHQLQNSAWYPEGTLNCPAVPASMLTKAMKDQIFKSVTEDYSGFQVKVTKSEEEYAAAPPERRMRCVVTHNMIGQFGNVGGTAYIGSMFWADDTPCFVFCDPLLYNEKYISGAVAHELGHTFGLQHQARFNEGCALEEEYHSGAGDGALSWAPIMGLSYYKSMVTWHEGPSVLGCDQVQNDMATISCVAGMKTDDFNAVLNTSAALLPSTGNKNGCLEFAGDEDVFRKNDTGSKRIKITSGGNSDIALDVYNQNGQLVNVYDNANNANINVIINGKKYLRVRISSSQPHVPVGDGFGGYVINVSTP